MDTLSNGIAGFGVLCTAVWALTEVIAKAFPKSEIPKDRLALILGPGMAILATISGLFDFEIAKPSIEGLHPVLLLARKLLASGIIGAVATVLTGIAHDKVIKPALPAKTDGTTPPDGKETQP